jgi:hypothetical protein
MSISDQGLPELASICSVPAARDRKIGLMLSHPGHSQARSVTRTTREAP